MKKSLSLLAAICLLLVVQAIAQTNFYVSPTGSDANSGTSLATPWRTINHAANSATPGSTVHILAGTYNEQIFMGVSGTPGNPITFRNYQQDLVEITGQGIVDPYSALILIENQSNLILRGMTLRSLTCPFANGVLIRSNPNVAMENITLTNLTIRNIGFRSNPAGPIVPTDNAHGIEVYGQGMDAFDPLRNIVIDSCQVFHNINGYSENITVNGNVSGFSITNCSVHGNTNIGIVAAGNYLPNIQHQYNHARGGLIAQNTVYDNVSPVANSAGIYCDGCETVIIERNHSYQNTVGIAVGCERDGTTANVTVRDNFVHHNTYTGIEIGGYTTLTTGIVLQTNVRNNTCFHNDNDNQHGELIINKVDGCNFIGNLFYSKGNLLYYISDISPQVYDSYQNGFYTSLGNGTAAEIYYQFNRHNFPSFQSNFYPKEVSSIFVDPMLVDTSINALDLHLQATSPVINVENIPPVVPGEKDYDGDDRANGIMDLGADEYYPYQAVSGPRADASTLTIYPNPATLSISIDGAHPSKLQLLSIYDVMGTLVHSESIVPASASVDISALPAGIYFVRLGNATGATKRLIKL